MKLEVSLTNWSSNKDNTNGAEMMFTRAQVRKPKASGHNSNQKAQTRSSHKHHNLQQQHQYEWDVKYLPKHQTLQLKFIKDSLSSCRHTTNNRRPEGMVVSMIGRGIGVGIKTETETEIGIGIGIANITVIAAILVITSRIPMNCPVNTLKKKPILNFTSMKWTTALSVIVQTDERGHVASQIGAAPSNSSSKIVLYTSWSKIVYQFINQLSCLQFYFICS